MSIQSGRSRQLSQRTAFGLLFVATIIVVLLVLFIISQIIINGVGSISWEFLTQPPSQAGKAGGIFPAIVGTFYLMLGTIILSLPIGVLAAIYLAEYAPSNWLTRVINLAIINLAGVPSIVYGLSYWGNEMANSKARNLASGTARGNYWGCPCDEPSGR
jgi:phosphate transport system permease protein